MKQVTSEKQHSTYYDLKLDNCVLNIHIYMELIMGKNDPNKVPYQNTFIEYSDDKIHTVTAVNGATYLRVQ